MSAADRIARVVMPAIVRERAEKYLVRIERATDVETLRLALERAEGFGEGLEVLRALNPSDLEALYIAFDGAATARRLELEG